MTPILTTDELAQACTRLKRGAFVTVDTEFIRDSTYWPELCLVQMASSEDETAYLVDPLAKELSLEPLFDLMKAKSVTKVMHAARQDIEIFHNLAGLIPAPLFDTQVAAMVCGFGDSVSYEQLVKRTLNESIDKSSRFTDWRRRPLTEHQIAYAVADVTHLRRVYVELSAQLEQSGRESWVQEEMATLLDPATYTLKPEDAWKRIKPKGLNRKALGVLVEVAAWREREAQARNVPRARIAKDEALVEVALQAPTTKEQLSGLRALPGGFANSRGAKALLEAVGRGLAKPKDDVPSLPRSKPMPPNAGPLLELLKVLLKMKCAEHGVAQKLVASTADLEIIASEDAPELAALVGWRFDVFGADALALKRGELALAVRGGALHLMPVKGDHAEAQPPRRRRSPDRVRG